nr:iron-containing redox enzyme family protein [Peterkaempfera bronchialis]
MHAALSALWRLPDPADRYRAYLRTMHTVIRASVPLMETAARRCADLGPADPVAGPLGRYLTAHIEEERHHDAWLLADLALAGGDPAEPLRQLPPPEAARLVGAQFYWVLHHHPVCLLGYIAVLEGHAPAPWLADRLARTTGLPDAAFRTVREHAVLDAGHGADLDALLDRLPLTPEQESWVAVSALHTVAAAVELLRRPDPTVPHAPPGGAP